MRIIGGKHKGRRFFPPKNNPARPTTDIAKEGLFNILTNCFHFETVRFLDLFGGTGSISYEFGSRGCEDITLVEKFGPNVVFIKQTAAMLDLPIKVIRGDVFKFIENCSDGFDVIFAGPPYPLPNIPDIQRLIFEHQLLNNRGWLILEHNPAHNFTQDSRCIQVRNYGTTIFSIFEKSNEQDVQPI